MVHPLVTLIMAVAVEVVGPSTCPEPADVTTALAQLPAPGSEDASGEGPPLVAEIRRPTGTGAGLSITLRTQAGAILAERVITESGSCVDLAGAAAVVIAAWQRGLRPDLGPELPRSAPGAIAAKPAHPTTVTAAPAQSAWPMELGVAALAAAVAGDVAPGLQVDATIGSFGWGLGPRLVGSIESPHGATLGPVPGKTLWSRSTLGVGVRKRSVVGAFMVDAQVHVKAAFVRVRGEGFDENYTASGADVGGGLGVQIGWPYRWFAPFLGVGTTLWAGRKTVEVTGTAAETTLPRYDVSLALGVSVGRFR
jgi:hypothetical protein